MADARRVKGAVYFPSRAYNAWQTFDRYDSAETERDFGYAERAGINTLRVFTSYEFWKERKEDFAARFSDILEAAGRHGIRILPVLFENCGRPFTRENACDRDPRSAVCVQSPGHAATADRSKWPELFSYADAFLSRWGNDGRLIAIELMNEPHEESGDVPFALALARHCRAEKGSVPFTIGCMKLSDNLWFGSLIDVYCYHDNFPASREAFARRIDEALFVQEMTGKPVWLTEWQRVRESGEGWGKPVIPEEEKKPALHTLADIVYSKGTGSFFWSLMVKPAYLPGQRLNGTYNGLLQEDGSVSSREDWEAVAGRAAPAALREDPDLPLWYRESVSSSL